MLRRESPPLLPAADFTVLDWQTCCKGNGLIDIATICDAARLNKATEERVLRVYHRTMLQFGMREQSLMGDNTLDAFMLEYRFAKIWSFVSMFPFLSSFWHSREASAEQVRAHVRRRLNEFVLDDANCLNVLGPKPAPAAVVQSPGANPVDANGNVTKVDAKAKASGGVSVLEGKEKAH